jgi:GNAT superfamily N-acetyltransferase
LEIEVRLIKPDEYEFANDLYNRIYGDGKRPYSFFEWEFLNNPFGKAIYIVAVDKHRKDNPVIGTQSVLPINFMRTDGIEVLTGKSEDTLLDPEYRGMGLFGKMYKVLFEECEKAGINYIWGFTYAKKPFVKIGFDIPLDTIQGLYCIKPVKAYKYLSKLNPENSIKEKLQIALLVCASKLSALLKGSAGTAGDYVISEETLADKTDLLKTLTEPNDQMYFIAQNEAYNNWRLTENPYPNSYKELSVKGLNGKVLGNVIYNIRPEGFAYICQILIDKKLPVAQQNRLIKSCLEKIASNNSVGLIRFWGFEHNAVNKSEIDILKRNGFVFIKKGTGFVWKIIDKHNSTEIIDFKKLHLSRIYTQGNV